MGAQEWLKCYIPTCAMEEHIETLALRTASSVGCLHRNARLPMKRRGYGRCALAAFGIIVASGAWSAEAKKEPVAPRTELEDPCSRVISRLTRRQVEKEVIKPASKQGIDNWPEGGPFDPKLDKYGHHELQKQRKKSHGATAQWTCGICGKVFK